MQGWGFSLLHPPFLVCVLFLACHPYISFQILSFPVSICMPHFLNKLLWILCLATHWEWVWSFCVMVNIANMDLLHSFHGEGAWSFCIPCLRTVHLSFHASGIKMCTPGYPAVVACLYLQVWSKYAQIHMLLFFFFSRTKQPSTFPMICSNHALWLRSNVEASSYWPFEWLIPGPAQ